MIVPGVLFPAVKIMMEGFPFPIFLLLFSVTQPDGDTPVDGQDVSVGRPVRNTHCLWGKLDRLLTNCYLFWFRHPAMSLSPAQMMNTAG